MLILSPHYVLIALGLLSCAGATKKATESILVGGYYKDPAVSTTTTPTTYGPGNCVNIWRSKEGHCVMQTKCKAQDISHYVFSMLCIDQGGLATRNVFGEGSFGVEETFDTLIICNRCAPDAPTGYIPEAQQPAQKVQKLVTNSATKAQQPAGTITIIGQGAQADAVEAKSNMVTQSQLHAVQHEVDELKVDMQSMNKAINQLGLKIVSAQTSPQVIPATPPATSAVVVERKMSNSPHHAQKRLRQRRIVAPHINDDGEVADPDEEDDAAIAAGVADTDDADDDDDSAEDNTVAFHDALSDDEEDSSISRGADDDQDDR